MSYYQVLKYSDQRYFSNSKPSIQSSLDLETRNDVLAYPHSFYQCSNTEDLVASSEATIFDFQNLLSPNSFFGDSSERKNCQSLMKSSDINYEGINIYSSKSQKDIRDRNTSKGQLDKNKCFSRRKLIFPTKSPPLEDPNFRGIILSMKVKVDSGVPDLIMTSSYRNGHRQRMYRRRNSESLGTSNSDSEEEEERNSINNWKQCASCNTTKTPLWRDAEDGTPLCNACGIRYKKYHVRCTRCWRVPKKGDRATSCSSCGSHNRQHIKQK